VKPPRLICPLCEFDIDHRHHYDQPPVVPCRSCFVGLHDFCDPTSYWCACDCGLGKDADVE